jgi:hypothetical protein
MQTVANRFSTEDVESYLFHSRQSQIWSQRRGPRLRTSRMPHVPHCLSLLHGSQRAECRRQAQLTISPTDLRFSHLAQWAGGTRKVEKMTDTTRTGDSAGKDRGAAAEEPAPRVGRRKMILGVAAAGVGASVLAGAEPAGATDGNPVLIGEANTAKATTSVATKKGNGLQGQTSAEGQSGVQGVDTSSGGGYGVSGTSTNGIGVWGVAHGEDTFGVFGYADGADGRGVFGSATGADGYGVVGYADGADGYGVAGNAAGENSYGVYAQATASGSVALYAQGNAEVTGSLSKGGGSFKIDHPVDPTHKYLYHSFVESPDMKNVYDGTVILDGDGRATVELPDWFEALNRDCRYQLTAIGSSAPDLHISREVKDGRFSIAGGSAEQKVSWQVTGIRQDAWANANRIPVEVDKKAEDQGRYLHPELFGGEAITSIARARERTRHATRT